MKLTRCAPARFSVLLSCAAAMTGCNQVDDQPASDAKPKRTIGVSLLTLDNPFFKVIGDNIIEAGKKQGYDVIVVSGDKDVAKQGNQIKDFIVQGVAAIVLSPCDSKSIVPVIQEANAAGIPVFTVDIPCNEPGVKIVTQIATDNFGGGREAGEAMIEALGEAGGPIAVLIFGKAESCLLRVNGFKEVIDAYNASGKSKIEIVAELESDGSKDQGYKATEDALQAHPEIRGIFAINDPAALGRSGGPGKSGQSRPGSDHRIRRPTRRQAGDQGRQDLRRPDPVSRQDGSGYRRRHRAAFQRGRVAPGNTVPHEPVPHR